MPEPTTPDRLDDLLNERLGREARARLLEEAAADPQLGEELALRTDAATAARRAAVTEHIRAAAREDAFRRRSGVRLRTLSSRGALAAAASVLLLVVAGLLVLRSVTDSSPEALAAAYFEPDPGLPTTLGSEDDVAFTEAMIDYKLGDYGAAAARWERLRADLDASDTLSYFYGVTLLAAERADEAVGPLREVRLGAFVQEARWYEALALLRSGEEAQARRVLQAIAASEGTYADSATSLLQELE